MVYRLGTGTALPGNMALGAASDPTYAKMAGQIIGRELSAIGVNTNLAPVVDVNNNPNNPVIGLRAYSDDAALVGNEGHGLSQEALAACTDTLYIPMAAGVESLNAGIAASVILWELYRGQ
jgi:beta-glucosidase-like glycosyl hydrolase